LLNDLFSGFDWLVDMHGMERIRTLGDAYMAVSGIPAPHPEHTRATLDVALEMLRIAKRFNSRNGVDFKVRIGVSSGPVMAGIVGRKKFLYYVWGPTVNIARDLESSCPPDSIQADSGIRAAFREKYIFKDSEHVAVVGHERVAASFLVAKGPAS
jgi:class 3 adenylate cyclase